MAHPRKRNKPKTWTRRSPTLKRSISACISPRAWLHPPHVTGVEVSSVLIAENTLILSPKGWSEGKRSGEGERRVSYQRKKAKGYPLWRGPFAF